MRNAVPARLTQGVVVSPRSVPVTRRTVHDVCLIRHPKHLHEMRGTGCGQASKRRESHTKCMQQQINQKFKTTIVSEHDLDRPDTACMHMDRSYVYVMHNRSCKATAKQCRRAAGVRVIARAWPVRMTCPSAPTTAATSQWCTMHGLKYCTAFDVSVRRIVIGWSTVLLTEECAVLHGHEALQLGGRP
jgi:hypothetical protein